jgi:hypothetical protein
MSISSNFTNEDQSLEGVTLTEKDQLFIEKLDKKLSEGLINQNDYNISKSAIVSKYKKSKVKNKIKKGIR